MLNQPSIVLLTALLAAPAAAQTANVAAIPDAFTGAHGNANWFANGQVQYPVTLQWWYRGDSVGGPRMIHAIGVRAARGTPSMTATETVTVKLDNSALGFGGLDKTWAKNLSKSATTFFSGKVNYVPSKGDDPNQAVVWMKGSRPFPFLGPNLLVHHEVKSFIPANGTGIDFDMLSQDQLPTVHSAFGRRCGALLTASYDETTSRFGLSTFAGANRRVTFMLGQNSEQFGSMRLPIDLSPLGMKGCDLSIAPLVFIHAVADSTGNAKVSFPYKLPGDARIVKAQAVHTSGRTSLGLASTNATTSVLGSTGLCNQIWALGGKAVADGGPFAFNSAPITLIR